MQLHRHLFVAVAVSLAAFVHQWFVQLPFLQLLFLLFIAVAVPWCMPLDLRVSMREGAENHQPTLGPVLNSYAPSGRALVPV